MRVPMNEEGDKRKVDLNWDDEHVLPAVLSPDTEFVFQRMTEETLRAAGVNPTARSLGATTAWAPTPSAVRRQAPRL